MCAGVYRCSRHSRERPWSPTLQLDGINPLQACSNEVFTGKTNPGLRESSTGDHSLLPSEGRRWDSPFLREKKTPRNERATLLAWLSKREFPGKGPSWGQNAS
ncbi:hypothetical protein LEMLEM_LOCUS8390 [Lemmus lemmus]